MVLIVLLALAMILVVVAAYYFFALKNNTMTLLMAIGAIASGLIATAVVSSSIEASEDRLSASGEVLPSPESGAYMVGGEMHIALGDKIERIAIDKISNVYYIEGDVGYYVKYSSIYDNFNVIPWVMEDDISYDIYLPLSEVYVDEFQARFNEETPSNIKPFTQSTPLSSPEPTPMPYSFHSN